MLAAMMNKQATRRMIVGLGVTGLSVARYLVGQHGHFTVADSRQSPPGLDELKALDAEVDLQLGEFDARAFSDVDQLIVSPGVDVRHPAIQQAMHNGVEVLGDIELFASVARAPVVAITGSNGKSTVTSLVADMARRAGRTICAGGNLGTPALDLLVGREPEFYVLELSSFQLETTFSLAAHVAVVLNVSEDHFDRYEDLDGYAAAKARIYENARVKIVNRDDKLVSAMSSNSVSFGLDTPQENDYGLREIDGKSCLVRGAEKLIGESCVGLPGRHNTANALAALAIGNAMGLPLQAMRSTLRSYEGLPHRCQRVAIGENNVTWYNDSKATNVGATLAALQGLPGKVVLIAGGLGKDADFSPLREAVAEKARAVVLIGRDADHLARVLEGSAPIVHAKDMAEAVSEAAQLAQPDDSVLLAPACASFDMFDNYMHRGDVFTRTVRGFLHD